MKKLIALLLAVCMVLGLMTTVFAADGKSNDIVILYTNDVHCAVDDNIGYAGLAAYKKEMQAAYNYVALVDCGDSVQGDVIGTLSKGEYLVDIMNELGYDFASFGNHEFDYTIIKRLGERGILKNENGLVTALVSRDEAQACEIDELVEKKFEGSLPTFIAAFTRRQDLSDRELDEVQQMIDRIRRGETR